MTDDIRESDVERYLVVEVRKLDGEVRKIRWVGRRNAPDRVLMMPRHLELDTTIWVELKRPGIVFPSNGHERAQFREHMRMRRAGQRVEVIDSFAGVDRLLAPWGMK